MAGGKIYRYKKKRKTGVTKSYVDKKLSLAVDRLYNTANLSTNFNSVGNTWVELDLTAIAVGAGANQREGRDIHITGIEFNGVVAIGDETNVMRIVCAKYDRRNITPLASHGATIHQKLLRQNVSGLQKVYKDRYIKLIGGGDTEQQVIKWRKDFKRKPIVLRFKGAFATDNQDCIVISMISDSAAIAHPGFTHGYWIIYYTS